MFLFNKEDTQQKETKKVKDIFGNDIELDSNGNVILKKERVAILKDIATKTAYKETIQMDISEETAKYATKLLSTLTQHLRQIQIILKNLKLGETSISKTL